MFNLKGRVAVVSSAPSGLGRQMSKAFAEQWSIVVVLARRLERLEELKSEFEPYILKVGRKKNNICKKYKRIKYINILKVIYI